MKKICFKCKIEKNLNKFYKHSEMKDGFLNKCIECTKKDSIKNRNENKDYYLEYDRERSNLPKRVKARKEYMGSAHGKKLRKIYLENYKKTESYKETAKKSTRKWREENRKKFNAHGRLNYAVKTKKIKKENCKFCNNIKTQGHHYDYDKPLEVIWLCASCHIKIHLIEKLKEN